jgi:hypothetical protein
MDLLPAGALGIGRAPSAAQRSEPRGVRALRALNSALSLEQTVDLSECRSRAVTLNWPDADPLK